ncbi:hypothetical protein [Pseudooceanicola atlanticus]|uniref:hypothetical protein n=1 Tax=Pseudooceanicola atlanticus TaxID=1461694 RepID=UPI000694D9DE|nr:hypothetical protein [Pseudooceanicola atlanticus]
MTTQQKVKTDGAAEVQPKPTGLDLLRQPFAAHHISKLPKPTRKQTEEVRADFKKGIRCQQCGQWHHPQVQHLDYVGHAALTDRLLDCDPNWNWEPVAFSDNGTPLLDENGGMWIKLTVCDQTRLGYGHPDGKKGGDAIKEVIGDALRNAAMRFGAALDLWHKGDLHADEPTPDADSADKRTQQQPDNQVPEFNAKSETDNVIGKLQEARGIDTLTELWREAGETILKIKGASKAEYDRLSAEKDRLKAKLTQTRNHDLGDDEIPF